MFNIGFSSYESISIDIFRSSKYECFFKVRDLRWSSVDIEVAGVTELCEPEVLVHLFHICFAKSLQEKDCTSYASRFIILSWKRVNNIT